MDEKEGIKKQYLKSKPTCKVSFRVPRDDAKSAETVTVAGEFNNWDVMASPMKLQKNGDFMIVVELEKNREYRFRYFLNGEIWENDRCADRYEPNPFGGFDSIVVI